MTTIPVYDLFQKLVLVTRGSARTMQRHLMDAVGHGEDRLVLDFRGVEGLAPSFFDEVLSMIEEATGEHGERQVTIRIENPPTKLSSKFTAVARAHGVEAVESEGAWVIS